ncbi:MAG: hypothetical protein M1823_005636 [Watsoniomyces obsoletus]|nr:MAG: hypothetical protein M1823_005636 [Watsoniomyces obsoletus]
MKPATSSAFNLETCVRPNILNLQPYRCARDDYKDDGTNILLDANENAHGPGLALDDDVLRQSATGNSGLKVDLLGLNRYPDPHQAELKQAICDYRNAENNVSSQSGLQIENLFVGVGSDEAIDAILRCFCRPGHDKILTCPPTYGMYGVSAQVNDLQVVHVPLDVEGGGFGLRPTAINAVLSQDATIKVVYVCSPGNPTGKILDRSALEEILGHPTWNGIVVVDEAYIDFAPQGASMTDLVLRYPNLIVMQTLSKAFGLAGIRLGVAITTPEIARLLNNLKAPYNISSPTSALATAAFRPESIAVMKKYRGMIISQRERLVSGLSRIPGRGRFRGGFDANFVLVEFLSSPGDTHASRSTSRSGKKTGEPSNEVALKVYEALAGKHGVVVRFRGKELGCQGCLRITVGTEKEVTRFLEELKVVLERVYRDIDGNGEKQKGSKDEEEEEQKERDANDVVA